MRHFNIKLNPNEKRTLNVSGLGFSVNEIDPFNAKVYYLVDHRNETVQQFIGRNIKYNKYFKSITIINTEEIPVSVDFYVMETLSEFENLSDPSLLGLRETDTSNIKTWKENKVFEDKSGFIIRQLSSDAKYIFDNYVKNFNGYFFINKLTVINYDTTNPLTVTLWRSVQYNNRKYYINGFIQGKILDTTGPIYIPVIKDITSDFITGALFAGFTVNPGSELKLQDYIELPIIIKKDHNLMLDMSGSTNYKFIIDFSSE